MAERKPIHILGVPMDMGTHRLGVDMGPNALRCAGLIPAMRELGIRVTDAGNVGVPTPESRLQGPTNMKYVDDIVEVSSQVCRDVQGIVAGGALPLVLGGDHSVNIGALAGVAAAAPGPLGLVWIDAHPDANTPETTLSGNVHGMSLAVALGWGEPRLVGCGGFAPKITPDRVCLLGAKDIDPAETTFLEGHSICMHTMDAIEEHGVRGALEDIRQRLLACTSVYVSLDLDVIDSSFCPGVGIRSHGGFTYREIKYICRSLGRHFPIAGVDVVEFNPIWDRDNQTAQLTMELILALMGYEYGDYQRYLKEQVQVHCG